MHNNSFRRGSGRLLALAALTATAVAAKPAPEQPAPAPKGMKAFKDPVTGELTAPTPQQAAELEAAKRAMAPPKTAKPAPVPHRLPQGGVGLKLDESQMMESHSRGSDKPGVRPAGPDTSR